MTTMDSGPATTGQRRKRHELEGLILETGRRIIETQGLGTAAEHLTFKVAFDQLEREQGVRVTNASVIGRIWENQEEFQRAVLRSLLADGAPDLTATTRCVTALLTQADLSSGESRRRTVIELCRVASAVTADAMQQSSAWGTWVALTSLHCASSEEKRDPQITALLQESVEQTTAQVESLVSSALDALGLTFSPGADLALLACAMLSLAQGTFLHDGAGRADARTIPMPTGPGGGAEDWTLLGIGILSLVDRCCRPIEGAGAEAP